MKNPSYHTEENNEWLMSIINGISEFKHVQEHNVEYIGSSNNLMEDMDEIKVADYDVRIDIYHYFVLKEKDDKYVITIFDPIELWDNTSVVNRVKL